MKLYILIFRDEDSAFYSKVVIAEDFDKALNTVYVNWWGKHGLVKSSYMAFVDQLVYYFELVNYFKLVDYLQLGDIIGCMGYWGDEEELEPIHQQLLPHSIIIESFMEDFINTDDSRDIEEARGDVMEFYEDKFPEINFTDIIADKNEQEKKIHLDTKRPYYKNIDKIQQYIGIRYTNDKIQDILDVLFDNGVHPWDLVILPKPETNLELLEIINTFTNELSGKWGYEIYKRYNLLKESYRDILWGILQHFNT